MFNSKSVTQSGVHSNNAALSPTLVSLISRWGYAFLAVLLAGAQPVYGIGPVCELKVNFCHNDDPIFKTMVACTFNGDEKAFFAPSDKKTLNLHDEKTLTCTHDSRCHLIAQVGMFSLSSYTFYPCGTRVFISFVVTAPKIPSREYLFSTGACRDKVED